MVIENSKGVGGPAGYSLIIMAYRWKNRWTGYGFWCHCPKKGIQFYVSVLNRVCILSFVLKRDLKWRVLPYTVGNLGLCLA